jgi:hypothetical protein
MMDEDRKTLLEFPASTKSQATKTTANHATSRS